MAAATGSDAAAADSLDKEIADLRSQAELLRKMLKIECATILSSTSTQALIPGSAAASSPSSSLGRRLRRDSPAWAAKLAERYSQQQAYMQQCVYRVAAPVTAFKVRDPDPNAVDGGHVLGLRFEVMLRGQFLRPYYVMLNRPFPGAKHLRVHRHTVPPAVPLAGLAARHLPAPASGGHGDGPPAHQDLDRFARALRREIARYHNRLGVAADLRRRLGLHEAASPSSSLSADSIVEVGIADIQAKQIKLTWADERSGRLTMDDDGNVQKLVIFGNEGRDWETAKELFGTHHRIEDIVQRLQEHGEAG